MRMKQDQVEKLARLIFRELKAKDVIRTRKPDKVVQQKIQAVITKDLIGEDSLEDKARALLEKFRPQIDSGAMDEYKALQMIKKQLAKDEDIIL